MPQDIRPVLMKAGAKKAPRGFVLLQFTRQELYELREIFYNTIMGEERPALVNRIYDLADILEEFCQESRNDNVIAYWTKDRSNSKDRLHIDTLNYKGKDLPAIEYTTDCLDWLEEQAYKILSLEPSELRDLAEKELADMRVQYALH